MICATALKNKTCYLYLIQLYKLPVTSLFKLLGLSELMNDLYVCSNECLTPTVASLQSGLNGGHQYFVHVLLFLEIVCNPVLIFEYRFIYIHSLSSFDQQFLKHEAFMNAPAHYKMYIMRHVLPLS